ncbi:AfsR/SARP family transcriptional regulator [Micromonospora sp. CA-249363]|uniref:AfsR/SARP family transcriptional regulator n=1 Tax=Micromonospora sp. CA-249363 TaxID=3239963 RepID=UPI003D8A0CC4
MTQGATVQVLLLGPIEVRVGGRQVPVSPLERALVALLALTPARTVSTTAIVDALWGDNPPQSARTRVQALVSGVRRKLAGSANALATRAPGYALAAQIDNVLFGRLLDVGRDCVAKRDAERACAAFDEAMNLWRGPALGGVDAPYAGVARATLSEAQLLAVEEHAEAQLACGRHRALTPSLVEFVATHPFRERSRGQLMVALYRSGQQSEAIAVYRAGRDLLHREMGVEPCPQLQELHQRILRHDPCVASASHHGLPGLP